MRARSCGRSNIWTARGTWSQKLWRTWLLPRGNACIKSRCFLCIILRSRRRSSRRDTCSPFPKFSTYFPLFLGDRDRIGGNIWKRFEEKLDLNTRRSACKIRPSGSTIAEIAELFLHENDSSKFCSHESWNFHRFKQQFFHRNRSFPIR